MTSDDTFQDRLTTEAAETDAEMGRASIPMHTPIGGLILRSIHAVKVSTFLREWERCELQVELKEVEVPS